MSNFNRKIILIIIFIVLIITALILYYKPANNEVIINGNLDVWAFEDNAEAIRKIAEEFKQVYQDVTIKVRQLKWEDGYEVITKAAEDNQLPDILQIGSTWITDMVSKGYLLSLEKYCYSSPYTSPSNFYLASKRSYVNLEDRKVYSIPFNMETRVLVYNKKIMDQIHYKKVPEQWSDIEHIDKLIKEKFGKNKYTIFIPENNTLEFLIFVWQNNSDIYNWMGNKLNFNNNQIAEALTYYKTLFSRGIAVDYDNDIKPKTGQDIFDAFKNEKIAMFLAGPWIIKHLETGKLKDYREYTGLTLIPALKNHTSFLGGSNLAISRDTTNKETAWKFIEFILKPENQVYCYKMTGDLPAVIKAWNDPKITGDKYLNIFKKQFEYTNTIPGLKNWEKISSKIIECIKESDTDIDKNKILLKILNDKIGGTKL